MSADKPEVNDVFLHNFRKKKYVVFKVEGREVHFLFTIDGTPQHFSAILDRVLLDYTYLGKSIENVNNIFQTEQDVANNVAKPDLQHLQAENNRLKTTLKNLKSLMLDPDCVQDRGDIYVMVRAIDEALNGESEEK